MEYLHSIVILCVALRKMNRLINPLINPRKKATQIIYTRSFVIHINILYVYIYITYIHSNSIFRLVHSKKKLRVRIYLCRGHEKSITSILKKTTKFSSWFCKIGSYVILSERERCIIDYVGLLRNNDLWRSTHFNLRTDQVQQRIGPESFALVDLPADLLPPHAAQDTDFLPG